MQSTWYEKAISFYQTGDYGGAIGAFTGAIEADPKDHWAYCFRAFAYYTLGNFNQAIGDFDKAIELGLENVPFITSVPFVTKKSGICGKQ